VATKLSEVELGMTIISKVPPKPSNYGHWWRNNGITEEWYREIINHRPHAHTFFMNWFGDLVRKGERIENVFEVGCGRAIPYATYFSTIDYFATDISEKEIDYFQKTYGLPADRFFVSDVLEKIPDRSFDVVFSHAVIDHVYDFNLFLRQLSKLQRSTST
jgi:2-polyprenyl-3-methyl-5-hydroxy-6-metoxy-1,4-benzoquinol methylase